MDEIVLRIKSDLSVTATITENGISEDKLIEPDEIAKAFQSSIVHPPNSLSSGILPPNIISVAIDSVNETRYYVLDFPKSTADISYYDKLYYNFPIPRLVFGFEITKIGRIQSVYLGIPADEPYTLETPMFHYPFSNVNGFLMCVGANELPLVTDIKTLPTLPYYFFGLPDNDDYYSSDQNKPGLFHQKLLDLLTDKDRNYYYDNILIPSGKTLNDFIERR